MDRQAILQQHSCNESWHLIIFIFHQLQAMSPRCPRLLSHHTACGSSMPGTH